MSVLFAERIKYDEEINLKLAKEKILNYFRRLTYIAIMLCSDDVLEEVFDNDCIKAVETCKEENFTITHYEELLEYFPNSKNILNKTKFIDQQGRVVTQESEPMSR